MSDQVNQEGQDVAVAAVDSASKSADAKVGKLSALMGFAGGLAAPLMVSLVVSVSVVAMGIAVYDKTRKAEFAVIDLAGIVELEQLRLTASVIRPGTTDDERLKAFQRVQEFGSVLEKGIEEIKADCSCVLLARNAFIGAGGTDYTDVLKRKVGLEGVDIESVRKMTEMAITRAVPSPESMRSSAGQPSNEVLRGIRP